MRQRSALRLLALAAAMLGTALLSLAVGARQDVGLGDVLSLLVAPGDSLAHSVVADIRLPRALVAAMVGANLGLAGLALQAITRNALASPSILGVSQGAALGLAVGLVFPAAAIFGPDIMAILGALVAGAMTLTVAGAFRDRFDSLRLILAGVAIGAFAFALARFTYVLDDDLSRQVIDWTTGSISGTRWRHAAPLIPWTLAGIAAAVVLSQSFNLLALGEEAAHGLGLRPRRIQLLAGFLAAVLTGVSVAAAGPIMFVGLIVPHLARHQFGDDHRVLVPATVLLGATLMQTADIVAKYVNFPYETSTGVICALIGAPYFLARALSARSSLS